MEQTSHRGRGGNQKAGCMKYSITQTRDSLIYRMQRGFTNVGTAFDTNLESGRASHFFFLHTYTLRQIDYGKYCCCHLSTVLQSKLT